MGILAPVTKMFFSKSGKIVILVTVKRAGIFMNCCMKKQISYNHALRIAENSCIYAFGSQIGMQCILHIQNIVFIYILYTCICVTHRSYTLNSKTAKKSNFHRSNVQLIGKMQQQLHHVPGEGSQTCPQGLQAICKPRAYIGQPNKYEHSFLLSWPY